MILRRYNRTVITLNTMLHDIRAFNGMIKLMVISVPTMKLNRGNCIL